MNDIPQKPTSGFLALVSYIPDPLGSFLHGLRQTLPGTDHTEPHVTVLPRRLLPRRESNERARSILAQFPAFDVEFSTVRHFPETNVLYLDVMVGNDRLHELHDALNTGGLAHPEDFEFRPHLTLSGSLPNGDLDTAQRRAEQVWAALPCPRRFTLEEIVCLWLTPESPRSEWRRLWSQRLAAKTSARGAS